VEKPRQAGKNAVIENGFFHKKTDKTTEDVATLSAYEDSCSEEMYVLLIHTAHNNVYIWLNVCSHNYLVACFTRKA